MATQLYWIETGMPGRLAIAPRPRGGDWIEEELGAWKRAGVDVIVSLLEPDEALELGLAEETSQAAAKGLQFVSFPIADRSVPESRARFVALLLRIRERLAEGKSVAVHCRQGVGRAGLVAIGVLIQTGATPEAAIQAVEAARGLPVPETTDQRRWISQFMANDAAHASKT